MSVKVVLTLSDEAFAAVRVAADAAGLSVEQWAADRVSDSVAPPGLRENPKSFDDDIGLPEGQAPEALVYQRRAAAEALADYDRTGLSFPLKDVLAEVRADLEARLSAKA